MFDPSNDAGERLATFRLDFIPNGRFGALQWESDRWYDVRIEWDLSRSNAKLFVDNQMVDQLPLLNGTLNGLSYVRLRAGAKSIDTTGFHVDDLRIRIEEPRAPSVSATQLREQENHYVENVVRLWK